MTSADPSASGQQEGSLSSGQAEGVQIAVVAGSKEGSEQVITMRDAKDPDGPVLVFTPAEWEAFTAGVRDGEFDLD